MASKKKLKEKLSNSKQYCKALKNMYCHSIVKAADMAYYAMSCPVSGTSAPAKVREAILELLNDV